MSSGARASLPKGAKGGNWVDFKVLASLSTLSTHLLFKMSENTDALAPRVSFGKLLALLMRFLVVHDGDNGKDRGALCPIDGRALC